MKKTSIQWTDFSWNVAVGCTKVDSDYLHCYMYRDSMARTRYNPNQVRRTKTVFDKPLKIKEPSKIFTSSLTDFFHHDIDSYRWEALDITRLPPTLIVKASQYDSIEYVGVKLEVSVNLKNDLTANGLF